MAGDLIEALMQIIELTVTYSSRGSPSVRALDHVSLGIQPGEVIGILGESGCGKSTLAASLLRLLPPHGHCDAGTVIFKGRDLLRLTESELRPIRGKEISLISQDPALSLNPVIRVGDQIAEVIRAHASIGRTDCRRQVEELL